MQREICSDSDGDPVVWEEFSNPTNGMRGDAGENVFEPGEGLDSHPLTGSHETPQYRGSLAAFIAAKEDPIVATNRHTADHAFRDRKSTRLNSSHVEISYAVFCLKQKNT